MQITRNTINTMAGPCEWFTGAVYVDTVATPSDSSRLSASSVHFTPGARTAWHTHPKGQTIVVTEGVGLAQRRGGPIEVIRADAMPGSDLRVRSTQVQATHEVQLGSLDGGATWKVVSPPDGSGAVGSTDAQSWWWIGSGAWSRSSDGGSTWAADIGHDQVAVVDVGLEGRRDEPAVGAGQDLSPDISSTSVPSVDPSSIQKD